MRKNVIRISDDAKEKLEVMADQRKMNYGALVEILIEQEWDTFQLTYPRLYTNETKFSLPIGG